MTQTSRERERERERVSERGRTRVTLERSVSFTCCWRAGGEKRNEPRRSPGRPSHAVSFPLHLARRDFFPAFRLRVKVKGKGFPYSIPSVGPGADPGAQAVSLQVTVSHPPGGRLPLLSCGYLPSRRASPPFIRRPSGVAVLTVLLRLPVPSVERSGFELSQGWTCRSSWGGLLLPPGAGFG